MNEPPRLPRRGGRPSSIPEVVEVARSLSPSYPIALRSVCGPHLYGFASPDAGVEVRGVHILPLRDVIGLFRKNETVEMAETQEGRDVELLSHDLTTFANHVLDGNGLALELLYSPLIVDSSPLHEELKLIVRGCLTASHARHYADLARSHWQIVSLESPAPAKQILHLYRLILTGIHLMRTKSIESNLSKLNETFQLSFVDDLVSWALSAPGEETLPDVDLDRHEREVERLLAELATAREKSELPDTPTTARELHELVVRTRLEDR